MIKHPQKLLLLITELGYFCSHRLALALAAHEAGFDVHVVTNCGQRPQLARFENELQKFHLHHVSFHRSRLNPFQELKTLWQVGKLYRQIRPHIVHQVALKPVTYGTFCAYFAKVQRVVNSLGGMGYIFTHQSLKSRLLRPFLGFLFRTLLNNRRCILILQNGDDVELMATFVGRDKIRLVRGVGVDLQHFQPSKPQEIFPLKALMVSRLLWSKGIGELMEAARILKAEKIPLQIQVAGDIDPQNPASVSSQTLETWKKEDVITWLGPIQDVVALYPQNHIAILPSYREGLPKSLLEAAACGKPIVTTDVPGCREVVTEGGNGFLIPPQNSQAIVDALKKLVASEELRVKMGRHSRQKAEQEFDEKKTIAQTLETYL